ARKALVSSLSISGFPPPISRPQMLKGAIRCFPGFFLGGTGRCISGKILGHGDEFVYDVVPLVQCFVCSRTHRTRSLTLRLALTVKTRSRNRNQANSD